MYLTLILHMSATFLNVSSVLHIFGKMSLPEADFTRKVVAFLKFVLYMVSGILFDESFLYGKWPFAITRLTAHCTCGLMSDLVICKHRKEYSHT